MIYSIYRGGNMNPKSKVFLRLVMILTVITSLALMTRVYAQVSTDQEDYSPGSWVTVSGNSANMQNGQQPYAEGQDVRVDIAGPNGWTSACNAVVDASGAWSCQFQLSQD